MPMFCQPGKNNVLTQDGHAHVLPAGEERKQTEREEEHQLVGAELADVRKHVVKLHDLRLTAVVE